MNATPSDFPFKSTGFATYPEPPQLGQSPGSTPLPLTVEDIVHDISQNHLPERSALRIPNKPPPLQFLDTLKGESLAIAWLNVVTFPRPFHFGKLPGHDCALSHQSV